MLGHGSQAEAGRAKNKGRNDRDEVGGRREVESVGLRLGVYSGIILEVCQQRWPLMEEWEA